MQLRDIIKITAASTNVFVEDTQSGKTFFLKNTKSPYKRKIEIEIDDKILNKRVLFIQIISSNVLKSYGYNTQDDGIALSV